MLHITVAAYGTQICVGTECKATVALKSAHLVWCAVLFCMVVAASCLRGCRAPEEDDETNPKYHHGKHNTADDHTEKPETPRIPSGLSAKELKERPPDPSFLTDDEKSYLRDQISRSVRFCCHITLTCTAMVSLRAKVALMTARAQEAKTACFDLGLTKEAIHGKTTGELREFLCNHYNVPWTSSPEEGIQRGEEESERRQHRKHHEHHKHHQHHRDKSSRP